MAEVRKFSVISVWASSGIFVRDGKGVALFFRCRWNLSLDDAFPLKNLADRFEHRRYIAFRKSYLSKALDIAELLAAVL